MTNTYRLSAPAVERDTKAILMRSLAFQVAVMLAVLSYMLFTGKLSDTRVLIPMLGFWGLLTGFIIWRVIRRVRKIMTTAIESYELTVDDLQIVRVQRDCPTVTIPRSAVRKIAERTGQGFRIETDSSTLNIWVPRELEGYDEVRNFLLLTTGATASTTQHPLVQTYAISMLSLAAFFFVMNSQRPMPVTVVGIGLVGLYIWYIALFVRTRANLTRPTRNIMWVIVFLALLITLRIATVWRLGAISAH